MNDSIGMLIGNGFGVWRKNLNLCTPFLFIFASYLLLIVLLAVAIGFLFGSVPDISTISTPQEALSQMATYLPGLGTAFLIFIIMTTLANSFFTAGGIAMAKQAIEEGNTSTRVMWSSGRKNFWNMFVASILIFLVMLAGFVLLLPGTLSLFSDVGMSLSENQQAIGLLAFGAIILVIYLLIMSLVLAVSPYALVVDDLGPLEAIKASLRFFSYNKFDVFMIWIIVVAISLGLQMMGSSAAAAGAGYFQLAWSLITAALDLLILAPLFMVWWTMLYMSRTGKKLYQKDIDITLNEPK